MTRYLELAEYPWLAEQVTSVKTAVLIKASRVDLARCVAARTVGGFEERRRDADYSAFSRHQRRERLRFRALQLLSRPCAVAHLLQRCRFFPRQVEYVV